MISRRNLLGRTATLAAAAAGVWLLRDRVVLPAARPRFATGARSSGWLDLDDEAGVPVVDARLDGRPVRALVDSGAQASVLDRGLAERLGALSTFSVPVIAFGLSGAPQTGRGAHVDVELGALSLPGMHVTALDLGPLASLGGEGAPLALVIGQDVLRTLVLDLDWPGGRLALAAPDAPIQLVNAVSAPARTRLGELYTDVKVEGFAVEAAVDTGLSTALALSEDVARGAGLLGPDRRVRSARSVTLGGASTGREVSADTLEVAGRVIRRATVAVYQRPQVSLLPASLVGSGAFRRTRALLDLGGGRLVVAAPETALHSLRR